MIHNTDIQCVGVVPSLFYPCRLYDYGSKHHVDQSLVTTFLRSNLVLTEYVSCILYFCIFCADPVIGTSGAQQGA